ncbi:hypothetical protein [Streptomyces sp. CCM_MD2014]|uniref:hypothetical protein n=1 Tax=Streptomyces sp. CCM_MD2014 TaxID=1561022 RepID=UPI00052AAE41|nr:hypothetical protein [Streptomyces sp. CCM_MD2014]AIV35978.1 hypothetical protein NI25_22955 [Streptomyces sp. CCM_MD2014]
MFEIRVITDPADADRVTAALAAAFDTGPARQYPTRDGKRTRLYVTADHRPEPGAWPTPEEAYALAPSIIREIGWTAQTAADKPFGQDLGREFWLRKAALLDRIALRDEEDGVTGDAVEAATEAARRLIAYDRDGEGDYHGAPYWPEHPATTADPRGYVRQEYAAFT